MCSVIDSGGIGLEKQEKVATRVVGARREQGNLSHWEVTVDWWQDAHAAGRLGYVLIKRVFDFLASLAGLIILAPLFIVIAIIIKVDDPKGPVFYSQQRLGRKERTFRMYKFRSMCADVVSPRANAEYPALACAQVTLRFPLAERRQTAEFYDNQGKQINLGKFIELAHGPYADEHQNRDLVNAYSTVLRDFGLEVLA